MPISLLHPWCVFLPVSLPSFPSCVCLSLLASSFPLPACKPVHSLSPLSSNSFPSNSFSPCNYLTTCPSNYTHRQKTPLFCILPHFSATLVSTLHFTLAFNAFIRCDGIASYVTLFTPSLERTLPSNTHTHTHQKRTHSAYNQRKEEPWASSVLGLHNSQEWCSGRPGWHLLGGNRLPDKYMYLPLYLLETPDLQRAHSYLVSIPWALREADPDSVPLSASLSVWYSTGEVEPGFIRTENTQMWMKELLF